MNGKHLAQTLVEGYYVMMGSEWGMDTIVVAVTDVAITHYFKLKLPSTRPKDQRRELEVVWHYTMKLQKYPPTQMNDLNEFVNFLHQILDEEL